MGRKGISILGGLMLAALMPLFAEEGIKIPVYGNRIREGSYGIDVESSSSMFRITEARLDVKGGRMTALITLGGTGYGKLFMGTGEEALTASEGDYIPFVENGEGKYTYSVPVEALDREIDCAAWSIRKEAWYDRVLVFQSGRIPAEDLADLPGDGRYAIDVTLSGGSGRAGVESPATLDIRGGIMTVRLVWTSPHYDLMEVDGGKYYPVGGEGNSVFEIPLSHLDGEIPLRAETVAMGTPHLIDYTLSFDSSTMVPEKRNPTFLTVTAIVLAAGLAAGLIIGRKARKG